MIFTRKERSFVLKKKLKI